MKYVFATWGLIISALLANPVSACIPIPPNPNEDAAADAVFFGVVVAIRQLPSEGPLIESALTIEKSKLLKGSAPPNIEVTPRCGDYYPSLNERVIVVRLDNYDIVRRAGGQYERLLLSALGHGR
ncbi:MAG: hypothetical protein HOP03_00105 [Lysobacter sp.]|nr:hypothetical protein [Lysobacter sp.]